MFTIQVATELPKSKSVEEILGKFYDEDLPFKYKDEDVQNFYRCWFIEHPTTKQLMNKVTVELEASESISLVIVLKSPSVVKPANMMSMLKITTGLNFIQKHIDSGKRRMIEDYTTVILCGRLENPIVYCTKSIMNTALN